MEILIVATILHFIPTIIAFVRGHGSKWAIFMLNLLLGWTVVFWFVAFIWSLTNKGGSQTVIVNNQINNGK